MEDSINHPKPWFSLSGNLGCILMAVLSVVALSIPTGVAVIYMASGGDWAKAGQFGDATNAFSTLFSGIAMFAALAALAYQHSQMMATLKQIRTTQKDNQRSVEAQNFQTVYGILQDDEAHNARHTILAHNIVNRAPSVWDKKEISAANLTLKRFELAGIMARKGYVDTAVVVESWGHAVLTSGHILREYVIAEREKNDETEIGANFAWLMQEAAKRYPHYAANVMMLP